MTQQFSKLNKLGATFKQSKKTPKFTIGKSKAETSSESEDDYEESIFQPNVHEASSFKYGTDSSSSVERNYSFIEQGVEVTEQLKVDEQLLDTKADTFLPSVGIVMGSTNEQIELPQCTLEQRDDMKISKNASVVNNVQLSSIMDNVSIQNAPEIQINSDGNKLQANNLKLDRKFSHSSGEVDMNDVVHNPDSIYVGGEGKLNKNFGSERDVSLNISQSQSESALKSKLTNLASPVTSVTKDLVLTPFSKFAKGVQNLGANLDPRKMSSVGVRNISEREYEEHRKLQEKWRNCKSRLIAL